MLTFAALKFFPDYRLRIMSPWTHKVLWVIRALDDPSGQFVANSRENSRVAKMPKYVVKKQILTPESAGSYVIRNGESREVITASSHGCKRNDGVWIEGMVVQRVTIWRDELEKPVLFGHPVICMFIDMVQYEIRILCTHRRASENNV